MNKDIKEVVAAQNVLDIFAKLQGHEDRGFFLSLKSACSENLDLVSTFLPQILTITPGVNTMATLSAHHACNTCRASSSSNRVDMRSRRV